MVRTFVRTRFFSHLPFWTLLLLVAVTYDVLDSSKGPPTLGRLLAAFGQPEVWLDLCRVMGIIYFSLWLFTRYAFPRKLPLVLGQILLLGLLDDVLHFVLSKYVLPLLTGQAYLLSKQEAMQEMRGQLLASWLIVMFAFVFKQLRDHRQREALLHEKNAIELAYLKSQLNPHFLFNSMNNLYGLALSEPERTPDAILMLSQLMRYMLYESNAERVSLTQEVSYLESYLALEKLRHEGEVHLAFTLEGDLEGVQIAPLLLICFVENAFKHGTVHNVAQPVQISLAVHAGRIRFATRNQIVTQHKDQTGGVGLPSVRRRLALLYPRCHQLTVASTNDSFCCVLELDTRPLATAPTYAVSK